MAELNKRLKTGERYFNFVPKSEDQKLEEKKRRMKTWRLIVRNLPFSLTYDEFVQTFVKFGTVAEFRLPEKNGHNAGYGFVQYWDFQDAVRAIRSTNGQKVNGRVVAVDYAVPKDTYMTAVLEGKKSIKQEVEVEPKVKLEPPDDVPVSSIKKEAESSEEEDDDESGESSGESGDSEEVEPPKRRKTESADVQEGKTLFLRNLSFDTTDDSLRQHFSQFGPISYAVVCKYPGTDHTKGTGFVKFTRKDDAEKCVERFDAGVVNADSGCLLVDGRAVVVCRAVARGDAQQLDKEKHEKKPKDNRNLHLLRIALIRPGSKEAEGMSQADVSKRLKIELANRRKLKDLNVFVSPTRLCVHNIPKRVADRELRGICLKPLNDSTARLRECRIMRDMKQLDADGRGQSRGYAFVDFIHHHHALQCLKLLNNNPDVFGPLKRPIVEFSLENRTALIAKKRREEKSLGKLAEMRSLTGDGQTSVTEVGRGAKSRRVSSAPASTKLLMPAVEASTTSDGGKGGKLKPLPSHVGPKIRHRRRGGEKQKPTGKKPKGKLSRKQRRENQKRKLVEEGSSKKLGVTGAAQSGKKRRKAAKS